MNFNLPKGFGYLKYIFLFIFSLLIFPAVDFSLNYIDQKNADVMLDRAGYSEKIGSKPVFVQTVISEYSKTHIISFLPEQIFSKENFDSEAAMRTISYVETFGREINEFEFNPYAEDRPYLKTQLIPRYNESSESYVIFISGDDPIPSIINQEQNLFPVFQQQNENNKTFSLTRVIPNGTATFVRFSEDQTWLYGLPTSSGKTLTPKQQLNLIFNVEIWKRSVVVNPPSDNYTEQDIITLRESLWNTFGRLIAAKQEDVPESLIRERLNGGSLSEARNRAYYPFDEKAQRLYEGAPTEPIIR